ncbi:hypothetical protein J6590_070250 [Homalodisca vitripennis]|nr:hypothetical protein J6590_070250 [Homalodisca vitripennis]
MEKTGFWNDSAHSDQITEMDRLMSRFFRSFRDTRMDQLNITPSRGVILVFSTRWQHFLCRLSRAFAVVTLVMERTGFWNDSAHSDQITEMGRLMGRFFRSFRDTRMDQLNITQSRGGGVWFLKRRVSLLI